MRRAKKPKPPAHLAPHECVILGIDAGEKAGAGILVRGRYLVSTPVRPGGEAQVVAQAQAIAVVEKLPLVVVAEKWTLGGRKAGVGSHGSITMLIGLGVAWGRWQAALIAAGVKRRFIVRVFPRTWQAKIVNGRVLKRDDMERETMAAAKRLGAPEVTTADEAAATCIAAWGSRAGEVHLVLHPPKKVRAPRAPKGAKAA